MNAAYLRSILTYDKATGLFRWKAPRKRVIVGEVAGSFDKDGYRIICIDQKKYRAGRLAVFYVRGRWPRDEVDHRNLDKADDRWDNLRTGSKSQNMRNTGVRSHSSTGIKCVQREKSGTYLVRVTVRKRRVEVGRFKTIIEAQAAHHAAVARMHGSFGRIA